MYDPTFRKFIIILLLFLCLPFSSTYAGQLYLWTDERGVQHITDQPPANPDKIIHSEKFREMTPAERRRYEAERDLERLKTQAREQSERHQRQINDLEAAAVRAGKERQDALEKRRKENAQRAVDDWEAYRERARYHEMNARSESSRLFWKDEVRKAVREISDNKKILEK